MSTNIIIVCILAFLLWYYFIKSKEYEVKNYELYNENQKIKKKNNFLQEYKNDISKTFKILNNELLVINEKVKNNPDLKTNFTDQNIINSLFNNINSQNDQSPVENTQIQSHEEPQEQNTLPRSSVFNNIFNRFLTDDLNSSSVLPNSQMYLSIDHIPLSRTIRTNTETHNSLDHIPLSRTIRTNTETCNSLNQDHILVSNNTETQDNLKEDNLKEDNSKTIKEESENSMC